MLVCALCNTDNAPLIKVDDVGYICEDCDTMIREDLHEIHEYYFSICERSKPLVNWIGVLKHYDKS